jgi:hypothetical protein
MVSKYELAIQVIVILASNVGLKIVAGYDLIRIEEDLDGVVN